MSDFAGTITEDMGGVELSKLLVDHWHMGAGSTLYFGEVIHACGVTGTSPDAIMSTFKAIDTARNHSITTDVLGHASVPEGNKQAVCDLLDQIQGLCVSF